MCYAKTKQLYDNDEVIANIFSEFFSNAVNNIGIFMKDKIVYQSIGKLDPILKAIDTFKYHESILKIKESINEEINLSFQHIKDERD